MRAVLKEIQDGTFAREWVAEHKSGRGNYNALKQKDLDHPIEVVGKKLRARMPWLSEAGARKPATANVAR
jgi:ketol-acid reductoisomerase